MDAQNTGYRVKIIAIVAAIFIAIWTIMLVTVFQQTGGPAADSSMHPAVFLAVILGVSLLVLWYSLGPIDTILKADQTALHQKHQQYQQQSELANRDVKRARDSIELANKSRHEFLSTMSRELRVPLNTIIGFSTLLYQNTEDPEVHKKRQIYAFDINKAAMHLLTIINDILDISNLGSGTSDLRIERISIYKLMGTCHKLTEIRGTKPGLAIIYDLPMHDFDITCDPARMNQILLNVVSNAITFTDPPGSVKVRVEETDDDYIKFTIADEGVGIPVDDMETVLQRFGRVDSLAYNVRNQESTGLGLTLVQELTRMHDGIFHIESIEDVGTTVTIKIPNDLMVNAAKDMLTAYADVSEENAAKYTH